MVWTCDVDTSLTCVSRPRFRACSTVANTSGFERYGSEGLWRKMARRGAGAAGARPKSTRSQCSEIVSYDRTVPPDMAAADDMRSHDVTMSRYGLAPSRPVHRATRCCARRRTAVTAQRSRTSVRWSSRGNNETNGPRPASRTNCRANVVNAAGLGKIGVESNKSVSQLSGTPAPRVRYRFKKPPDMQCATSKCRASVGCARPSFALSRKTLYQPLGRATREMTDGTCGRRLFGHRAERARSRTRRRNFGVAAISADDPPPQNITVVAAASPRPASLASPRRPVPSSPPRRRGRPERDRERPRGTGATTTSVKPFRAYCFSMKPSSRGDAAKKPKITADLPARVASPDEASDASAGPAGRAVAPGGA
mmetsp:Transcript_4676/g.14148  ORF Transcript_4676/g.14148 Transcript_4676/m.14148 type:complete len:367 (+) Transcript_4676:586-1686(+)